MGSRYKGLSIQPKGKDMEIFVPFPVEMLRPRLIIRQLLGKAFDAYRFASEVHFFPLPSNA